MWILSPRLGLLSIVVADDPQTSLPDPETVMIRARRREHLRLLQEAHPKFGLFEIKSSTPGLDYPWRLVVPKSDFVVAMMEMADDLGWRNVKAEAHRNEHVLGAEFVLALHEVHAVLRRRLAKR